MKNKTQTTILAGILLVITLLSLINASGVSSPYWTENPLKLNPGETRVINLTLQNMVGNQDVTFQAKLSSEENIATLLNANSEAKYLVPFGNKDVPVTIQIQVPSNAKVGKEYKINLLLNEVSSDQGGMLHVTSSVSTSFPVEVIGKTGGLMPSYLAWLLVGAILLVIIAIICFRKKNKKIKK
jgi:hypothetical protein